MNEAREIRLRLLEMVVRDGGTPDPETVLMLEQFIWEADVAKPEAPADSVAPATDTNGPV